MRLRGRLLFLSILGGLLLVCNIAISFSAPADAAAAAPAMAIPTASVEPACLAVVVIGGLAVLMCKITRRARNSGER